MGEKVTMKDKNSVCGGHAPRTGIMSQCILLAWVVKLESRSDPANQPRATESSSMHACVRPQLCLTLCDPMDCSSPGSSVLGILQAGILEWVTNSFSRESARAVAKTNVRFS